MVSLAIIVGIIVVALIVLLALAVVAYKLLRRRARNRTAPSKMWISQSKELMVEPFHLLHSEKFDNRPQPPHSSFGISHHPYGSRRPTEFGLAMMGIKHSQSTLASDESHATRGVNDEFIPAQPPKARGKSDQRQDVIMTGAFQPWAQTYNGRLAGEQPIDSYNVRNDRHGRGRQVV